MGGLAEVSCLAQLFLNPARSWKLADTLPLLGINTTVNPLDDYPYTPPYTSPIYHYDFLIRRSFLYSPLLDFTDISLLLPHYQYNSGNNQLPHLLSLRWHYYSKGARGSL